MILLKDYAAGCKPTDTTLRARILLALAAGHNLYYVDGEGFAVAGPYELAGRTDAWRLSSIVGLELLGWTVPYLREPYRLLGRLHTRALARGWTY